MTGVGTGAMFGPPGAIIGGAIGLVSGIAKGKQQQKLNRDYERANAAVRPVDPDQVAFLNRLRQQERFYRSGMDAASGFARQDQMNALAQTQANIARMGGGINQLLQAQQAANMGQAAIGAHASRMADPMLMAQGNLTDLIAQRKYDYYLRNRDIAMARMEQGRQDINNMFAGGMSILPAIAGSFAGKSANVFNPMNPPAQAPVGPAYGPDLPIERMAMRGYTPPTGGANDLIWR